MNLPKFVRVVEVGPRDGLQNEIQLVPTDVKIEFINRLSQTGLSTIEITSFVSPKWVPQMADHFEIVENIDRKLNVMYPVLVPNRQGFDKALAAGVKEIAIFASATETFSQKNIHCSIAESFSRFADFVPYALEKNIKVRGYLSCVLGCPYEGEVRPEHVASLAKRLKEMGCYEISLGDTIGVGNPLSSIKLINKVAECVPIENLAVHFHDTYGQALANIYACLNLGVSVIDSSVAGLGGCPYAPGASSNVATEDVLYLLHQMNIKTHVNLEAVCDAGYFITAYLKQPNRSKVAVALKNKLAK